MFPLKSSDSEEDHTASQGPCSHEVPVRVTKACWEEKACYAYGRTSVELGLMPLSAANTWPQRSGEQLANEAMCTGDGERFVLGRIFR